MMRIVLIGAGILASVVSGYLVKRALGQSGPTTLPGWPGISELQIPSIRSKKRPRHHPDGDALDNGAILAPESV